MACGCTQWSVGSSGGEGLGRTILTQNVLCLEPLAQQLFRSLNYSLLWTQLPGELHTFQNSLLFWADLFLKMKQKEISKSASGHRGPPLDTSVCRKGCPNVPKEAHITLEPPFLLLLVTRWLLAWHPQLIHLSLVGACSSPRSSRCLAGQ